MIPIPPTSSHSIDFIDSTRQSAFPRERRKDKFFLIRKQFAEDRVRNPCHTVTAVLARNRGVRFHNTDYLKLAAADEDFLPGYIPGLPRDACRDLGAEHHLIAPVQFIVGHERASVRHADFENIEIVGSDAD
jgi:hypothetical protein